MSEQQESQEGPKSKYDALTDREREVAIEFADCQRSRAVAEKLGISIKTVDTHRGHILKKLQLEDNPDLVRDAIVNGVVPVCGEHLPSLLAVADAARALANGSGDVAALRGAVEQLDSRRAG